VSVEALKGRGAPVKGLANGGDLPRTRKSCPLNEC
jgi:hypothetical protein